VGNKETMTYPDNKVVNYDYGKVNCVTGMTYPNGLKEANTYDDRADSHSPRQSPAITVKILKFQYAYQAHQESCGELLG